MKKLKNIFLIFIGVLFSLILFESALQIVRPPMLLDKVETLWECDSDFFFHSMYIEIYEEMFKYDAERGIYISQPRWIIPDGCRITKTADDSVKRIFIMGESVAIKSPDCLVRQYLKEFIPNQSFQIVKAAMPSYDSYRIEILVREVIDKFAPDYIVMMLGNNDGHFRPTKINMLPYRYKIFQTSYVLNYLANFLVPRHNYCHKTIQPFFERNILKMVNNAKGTTKIIFVTLAQNTHYYGSEMLGYFGERRDFLRTLPAKYSWVQVADFDKVLKTFVPYPGNDIFYDNCHYHPPLYSPLTKLWISKILGKDIPITEQDFQF